MNCARSLPLCSTQAHKPLASSPHSLVYVAFNISLLSTPNLLQLGAVSHCLEAGGEGTALASLQSPTCSISPSLVKHLLKPKNQPTPTPSFPGHLKVLGILGDGEFCLI